MIFVPIIPQEKKKIRYTCGKCGRETERDSVLQCPVCLTSLCDQCSNYSFCNEDFNLLSQDDKNTVISNYRPTQSGNMNKFMVTILIGVLAIGIGMFLVFRMIDFSIFDRPIIIYLLIGIVVIGGIAAILVTKNKSSTNYSRFEYITHQVAKNYRSSSDIDETISFSSNKAINMKYCSKCGKLAENGAYCIQCGEKLI